MTSLKGYHLSSSNLTFGNWGVASNYDLCIDSSVLGFEGTADLIIEYARKRGYLTDEEAR